ncbi:unnamed protein product [Ectocarpus fasciculatus]
MCVSLGAGASGIGAARELLSAGIPSIILEARDRTGGRVVQHVLEKNLTAHRDPSGDEGSRVVVQLGANWIHNCSAEVNPLYALAQQLGIGLHMTSPDDSPGSDVLLFDSAGDAGGLSGAATCAALPPEEYQSLMARWAWISDHLDNEYPFQDTSDSLLAALRELTEASAAPALPFGPLSDRDRRGLNWCFARLSIDSARPINAVSRHTICDQSSTGEHGEGLVQGGYYSLFQRLVAEFPLDIRLRHVATSVTTDDYGGVTVTCSNGEVFTADACVVTLPVPVLQSGAVSFTPPPPELARWTDSRTITGGLMNLVWLWYPEVFWPDNGTNFFGLMHADDHTPPFTTFLAPPMFDQHGVRQAVLLCQVFGDFARAIEDMSDKDIATVATAELRKMFGPSVPTAVGCTHSAWASDPFAQCSWATFPSNPAGLKIAGGRDSVYFAGEATMTEFRGTVHAAYLSGQREAAKIIRRFGAAE